MACLGRSTLGVFLLVVVAVVVAGERGARGTRALVGETTDEPACVLQAEGEGAIASTILQGTVQSVGDNGYWAVLSEEGIGGRSVLVRAKDRWFTFPVDAVGSRAHVEGTEEPQTYHPDGQPLSVMTMNATRVVLQNPHGHVCTKWFNEVRTFDLDHEDVNSPTMRAGFVCLAPGEEMALHSTEGWTEVVTVVKGEVVLGVDRGGVFQDIVLATHHSSLGPPGTPHKVTNRGHVQACYIYTVAATIPS